MCTVHRWVPPPPPRKQWLFSFLSLRLPPKGQQRLSTNKILKTLNESPWWTTAIERKAFKWFSLRTGNKQPFSEPVNRRGIILYQEYKNTRVSVPEILYTLDPSLLSFLVVPLVRELRSTRSCDFLNRGGGFIKGILRGIRCTKSLRVHFLHRRPPSWTTLVL